MKSFCLSSLFLLVFHFLLIQDCEAKNNRFSIDKEGIQTIESKTLRISLDSTFPRITQYNWIANGAIFYGQEDQLSQVMINEKLYTPKTSFSLLKKIFFFFSTTLKGGKKPSEVVRRSQNQFFPR